MNRLIEVPPTDIQREEYSTIFYFGAKASYIPQLPSGSEVVMVHSPKAGSEWRLVRYRTYGSKSGMVIIETRGLVMDEIAHFEQLMNNLATGSAGV